MFDVDSRMILAEIDPCVFTFGQVLDGMLTWLPIVHRDEKLFSLYVQMCERVNELIPEHNMEEVDKYLVCGFSEQK